MAFLEEHPEVQAESEALASCESNRSYAGRMIFNNADWTSWGGCGRAAL